MTLAIAVGALGVAGAAVGLLVYAIPALVAASRSRAELSAAVEVARAGRARARAALRRSREREDRFIDALRQADEQIESYSRALHDIDDPAPELLDAELDRVRAVLQRMRDLPAVGSDADDAAAEDP